MNFLTTYRRLLVLVLIPLAAGLAHWGIWNREIMGVHVWRQAQTLSYVQNFVRGDMNILNPKVNHFFTPDGTYRYEFPVMQWSIAALYRGLGEEVFLARLVTFLISLGTLWGMYRLARNLWPEPWLPVLLVWCITWSPLFFYYSVSPLPDSLAMMGGVCGLAAFTNWTRRENPAWLWAAAALLMLGTLAKLPFLVFYAWPAGWFLRELWIAPAKRGRRLLQSLPFLLSAAPWLAWYLWVIPGWKGNGIVGGILDMNAAQTRVYLESALHHLIATLPEVMVSFATIGFFAVGFLFLFLRKAWKHPLAFPIGLWTLSILAYFFFELNMIGKAHDYYLFPLFPGVMLITALGVRHVYRLPGKPVRVLFVLALIALPAVGMLRAYPRWNPAKHGPNPDLIQYQQEMRAAVPQDALVAAGDDASLHIWLYYLNRRGMSWNKDYIPGPGEMQGYYERGIDYLFSDSRQVDGAENVRDWIGEPLHVWGSIHLYKIVNGDSIRLARGY